MSIVHRTFSAVCKIVERHKTQGRSGFQENKAFPLNVRTCTLNNRDIGITKYTKRVPRQTAILRTSNSDTPFLPMRHEN